MIYLPLTATPPYSAILRRGRDGGLHVYPAVGGYISLEIPHGGGVAAGHRRGTYSATADGGATFYGRVKK